MLEVLLQAEVIAGVATVTLVCVLVLAALLVRTNRQLTALRREHARAFPDSADDVVAVLGRHGAELTEIREDLATIHGNTEHLRELLRRSVSRVGVVRYDAFEDMGGELSFSAALLDEHGDGIVVSAINGRSETRAYGKPVTGGTGEHHLSHEESEALAAAIERRAPSSLPPRTRRRRRAS